jgi:hypothetical protein
MKFRCKNEIMKNRETLGWRRMEIMRPSRRKGGRKTFWRWRQ